MSQPKTTFREQDGQIGSIAAGDGVLAIVGVAPDGPLNTPAAFGKVSAVVTEFGGGPLVELAARAIDVYGLKVCLVRADDNVAGSYPDDETISTDNMAGTSEPTVDTNTEPNDDYEPFVVFPKGGTVGTEGIEYQWSLDGGRTLSPVTALGTANKITIPTSGGIAIDLAAGTIVEGDWFTFVAKAPNWNATSLGEALEALKFSKINFECTFVEGEIDAAAHDVLETKFAQFPLRKRCWMGSTRMNDSDETMSAYATALQTALGNKATKHGILYSGACKLTSAISSRKYRRRWGTAMAPFDASLSQEENSAEINQGNVVGVSIRDANGNPDEYDESVYGSLDDLRFSVARTFEDEEGVYSNRPRLYSPTGSDFYLLPHRRVMNISLAALDRFLRRRLSRPIVVSKKTGRLLPEERSEIERGGTGAVEAEVRARPKASSVRVQISDSDNVLTSKKITGSLKIVPLAYPEEFEIEASFENPANSIEAV